MSTEEIYCSKCGEVAVLISDNLIDEWPRILEYVCSNGHTHGRVEVHDPNSLYPSSENIIHKNRKQSIKLYLNIIQEVTIFHAVGTIRKKIGDFYQVTAFLNLLEDYINAAIIQYYRILEEMEKSLILLRRSSFNGFGVLRKKTDKRERQEQENHLKRYMINQMIYYDIHYFFICLDKVKNLLDGFLRRISPLLRDIPNIDEMREKKEIVKRRFSKALSTIQDARHFIEHIDEKIRQEEFVGFKYLKDENGMKFIYSETMTPAIIDIDSLIFAYESLIDWINELPDKY